MDSEDSGSELIDKCLEMMDAITKNPNDYQLHENYLNYLLTQENEALENQVEMAREKFQQCFPLPLEVYLPWLNDRIEKDERVFELFRLALEDYVTVEVVLVLLDYCMEELKEVPEDLVEKLEIVKYHYAKGHQVWEKIRELDKMVNGGENLERLYLEELKIPLENSKDTLAAYKTWKVYENSNVDESVLRRVDDFQAFIDVCEPYENRLVKDVKNPVLWKSYIEVVRGWKETDQRFIKGMYERAINETFLDPSIWIEYVEYLYFDVNTDIEHVCNRALRNIKWNGLLWKYKLISLDMQKHQNEIENMQAQLLSSTIVLASEDDYYVVLDQWITCFVHLDDSNDGNEYWSTMNVWLTFWSNAFPNRKDRWVALFNRIMNICRIRFQSIYELKKFMGIQYATEQEVAWVQLITHEINDGHIDHARTLLQQACPYKPNSELCEMRIHFELNYGSVQQWRAAVVDDRLHRAKSKSPTAAKIKETKKRKQAPVKKEKPKPKQRKAPKPIKVHVANLASTITGNDLRQLFEQCGTILTVDLVYDKKGAFREFAFVEIGIPNGQDENDVKNKALSYNQHILQDKKIKVVLANKSSKSPEETWKLDPNTIYVSGFNQEGAESITKEDFKNAFAEHGDIVASIILKAKTGKNKGYGLIEFKNASDATRVIESCRQVKIRDLVFQVRGSRFSATSVAAEQAEFENRRNKKQKPHKARTNSALPKRVLGTFIPRKVQSKNQVNPKSNADFKKLFENAKARENVVKMRRYVNSSGYFFHPFDAETLLKLKKQLQDIGHNFKSSLYGTILLSPEGINFNLSGEQDAISSIQSFAYELSDKVAFKDSFTENNTLSRFMVKIRKEVIALGAENAQPAVNGLAPSISAKDFKQWMDEKKDMLVLDTRNDYETRIGTFDGAMDLNLKSFRSFPEKAKQQLQDVPKDKPIVMFCTGGVRCEKASYCLQDDGFENVYQLDGGILNYFQQVGDEHYNGDCFIFDNRIAVTSKLEPADGIDTCHVCRSPVTQQDQQLDSFVVDVSCPYCINGKQDFRHVW